MYREIGAYDAKTKLAELLREVGHGQRFTITHHGRPIADLVPTAATRRMSVDDAIEGLRNFPKIEGISAEDIRASIDEGRE